MATVTSQYRKLQQGVFDSAHKVFLAGLGTLKTVGDESTEMFDLLVERGRDLETRGKKEIDEVRGVLKERTSKAASRFEGRIDELGSQLDEQVTGTLRRLGVPTREEIQTLTRRVEELSLEVGRLAGTSPPAESARKTFHISPDDDGWKLILEGENDPLSVHSTKDQALTAGRETAKRSQPSQVVVHKMDGTIQSRFGYGNESSS